MIRENYFSFRGRLNRKPYWLRSLLIVALFIASIALIGSLIGGIGAIASGELPDLGGPIVIIALIVGLVAFIAFLVATFSIGVRRLHDRNKSGWWMVFFYIVPNFLSGETGLFGPADSPLALGVSLVGFAISIWALVELGFLKGTDGPNAYGPDPLDPDYEDASVFA